MQPDRSGPTRCVIYAAKSTADEHGSIESQLARCREHAERNGWLIAEDDAFHDEAASAYSGSRGPQLAAARQCAADLAADGLEVVLLVFASDRLARGDGRQAAHLVEYVLEATKAGYRIESVTENLGGDLGLVIAALYGERAHHDSKLKGKHTSEGKQRAAARGRRNGGPRPFGYKHVPIIVGDKTATLLEVVPAEADVVRRMYEDAAAGKSQSTIASELNASGVTTAKGAAWSQSRVSQTLRNPLYRGAVRWQIGEYDGEHEAIVSAELWEAASTAGRTALRRGNGRRPRGSHLLTGGLLRCACGAAMRTRTQEKSYGTWEAYICDGRHSGATRCTAPAVARAAIDEAVWRYFENVALDVDAMRREHAERHSLELATTAGRIDEAEHEHAETTAQLERIRRDYRAGRLDADEWKSFRDEIAAEIEAAGAALAQLRAHAETLRGEAELRETAAETLEALAAVRAALAGVVTGAGDLDGARRAMRQVFDTFTLHRYELDRADLLDADLAAGDWYLIPTIRADALLTPLEIAKDERGEVSVAREQQLRRVPAQLRGSTR